MNPAIPHILLCNLHSDETGVSARTQRVLVSSEACAGIAPNAAPGRGRDGISYGPQAPGLSRRLFHHSTAGITSGILSAFSRLKIHTNPPMAPTAKDVAPVSNDIIVPSV